MKKQSKIEKVIGALLKYDLTVREIASRYKIPNVYAVIDDIRKVHGFNVMKAKTRTNKTVYYIELPRSVY